MGRADRIPAASGDRLRRLASACRLLPGLIVAASLSACATPVGDSLFQPAALAAKPPVWTGQAPVLVRATADDTGLRLTGWHWPARAAGGDILVYLPGRAGNRDLWAERAQAFAEGGQGVLVASYRGYGDNAGTPSEQGLYEDGRAFVRLARLLHPKGRLFLFGDTLGAAVALRIAADTPVDAVVTLGAFDTYARFVPKLARPFYGDAFNNVEVIKRVSVPVLLMHGAKDEVVPLEAAERLKTAAGGKVVVVPIAGEAYHAFDLRHIAPVVWQALQHIAETPPRT